MALKKTWRWFGPDDIITLDQLVQIGVEGVVTSLHHKKPGDVWGPEEIRKLKTRIESFGLEWTIVESLPVPEGIKTRSGQVDELIDNYRLSLKNLGGAGIKTVVYNFMPVLDWARTDLNYITANGEGSMYFDFPTFIAFDLFILKRPAAYDDYPSSLVRKAESIYRNMNPGQSEKLAHSIMVASQGFINGPLAGANGNARQLFNKLIDNYRDIDSGQYRENLRYFLDQVMPVADEYGIKMAIHPDDPPFDILGLPRIFSTQEDIKWLLSINDSASNGFTFCSGSLGVRDDNDLAGIIENYGSRIHFVHLRNIKFDDTGGFYESGHLSGDLDMASIVTALLREQNKRKNIGREDYILPFRPDHGNKILDDNDRTFNPGYPLAGRLKGLAEIDGLVRGIEHITELSDASATFLKALYPN